MHQLPNLDSGEHVFQLITDVLERGGEKFACIYLPRQRANTTFLSGGNQEEEAESLLCHEDASGKQDTAKARTPEAVVGFKV